MKKVKAHLVLSFDCPEECEMYYQFFEKTTSKVTHISLFDDKRAIGIISTLIESIEQEETNEPR